MRLGIFGGSFDPVHYGHLLLAECAWEQCRLDQVWLLPAATAPHKQDVQPTSADQRMEMLRLAIAGNDHLAISTLEIERGGVSYTVDTLTAIQAEHPDAELFLLMGADSLHDLPDWRDTARICQLATPVVVGRPDSPPPDYAVLAPLVTAERLAEIQQHRVEMPLVQFSSTEIRQRVAAGKSIRYRTPRAVEKYIETAGLYR